ncbi:MAG: DUF4388 domain-containing protein, partial [Myxococcota bacterium]
LDRDGWLHTGDLGHVDADGNVFVVDRIKELIKVSGYQVPPAELEALLAVVEHALKQSPRPASSAVEPSPAIVPTESDGPCWSLASHLAQAAGGNKRLAQTLCAALMSPEGSALVREVGAMVPPALLGDLAVVPIAEVLQLLALQRQTGFLTVRHGAAAIAVAVQRGSVRLVTGENMGRDFLLGTILVQERLLRADELEALLSAAARTHERLGESMLRHGHLGREDLVRVLRRQSSELVYDMLRWRTGRFEFQRRDVLPAELLEHDMGLGIDELLMEGFRRVDEWRLIEAVLPSFDIVLARTPGSSERAAAQHLTESELSVLHQIDGQRSVREVMAAAGGATFDVARLLYRLVSAHLASPGTDVLAPTIDMLR